MAEGLDKQPASETVPRLTPAKQKGAVYGGRFALAYLIVVLAFGSMIGLFAYLVSRGESKPWSSYQPAGGKPFEKAQKIANHVAGRYLQEGHPIAFIDAQPPIISNTVVDGIAIARPSSGGIGGGTESIEPADKTVMYVFCARGKGCALPRNAATDAEPLLRRESLELALYTFKYVSGVDSIVTLLPPQKGSNPAIYLKRQSFENQLSDPLAATLPAYRSITTDSMSPFELQKVEDLTANSLYPSKFEQLPSGQAVLLLGSGK